VLSIKVLAGLPENSEFSGASARPKIASTYRLNANPVNRSRKRNPMKKSVLFSTTAATLGLATVLTFAAVSPSMAKGPKHSNDGSSSATVKTAGISFGKGAVSGDIHVAPKTTALTITLTNVPGVYTDAAALGKKLIIKVVPLAASATSAPATAPVPTFGGKPESGEVRPAPPVGAPAPGNAPVFGTPDNDGDGPALGSHDSRGPGHAGREGRGPGHGGRGEHGRGPGGFGPFGQPSTFTLSGTTLTGQIQIPAAPVAGTQNFAVYISIAADGATGLAAQSGTPVFVVATTDASESVTLGNASGAVTIDLSKNTGTIK